MNRLRLALLVAVAVLGFAAGYGFRDRPWSAPGTSFGEAPRSIGAAGSPPNAQAVQAQRRNHYADIEGMAQIFALPSEFARNEALYAVAGRADTATLERLIGEAAALPDESMRASTVGVLYGRYAEVAAPVDAMRAAARLHDPDIRQMAVYAIAEAWARAAPAQAYAYGMDIDEPGLRRSFIGGVLTQWAKVDPEVVLRHLSRGVPGMRKDLYVQQAMMSLAGHSPQRALELADRLDSLAMRSSAQQAVILTWAQIDVDAALRYVDEMPPSSARADLEQMLANVYAHTHPDEAIAWAQRLPGAAGSELLVVVLNALAQQDPQRAIEIAVTLETSPLQYRALSSVFSSLAWQKPEMAARYIERLPAGMERSNAIDEVASAWAQQDVDAASAWTAGLEEPFRTRAVLHLGNELAYNDPERAAGFIAALEGGARAELIQNIASGYAQSDPAQAREWITQFANEPEYPRLMGLVAMHTAARDPRAALDFASRIDDSGQRDVAIAAIVQSWASSDPVAASNVVERLSTTASKLAAVSGIVGGWAGYDPAAARNWAFGLKPAKVRDQALFSLVTQVPLAADDYVSIIGEIGSKTQRSEAIQQAVQTLAYQDRDAARSLLDRLPASADQKEALRCFLDDPSNFYGY